MNIENALNELRNLLNLLFGCNPCSSYDLFLRQWSRSEVSTKLLG